MVSKRLNLSSLDLTSDCLNNLISYLKTLRKEDEYTRLELEIILTDSSSYTFDRLETTDAIESINEVFEEYVKQIVKIKIRFYEEKCMVDFEAARAPRSYSPAVQLNIRTDTREKLLVVEDNVKRKLKWKNNGNEHAQHTLVNNFIAFFILGFLATAAAKIAKEEINSFTKAVQYIVIAIFSVFVVTSALVLVDMFQNRYQNVRFCYKEITSGHSFMNESRKISIWLITVILVPIVFLLLG